MSVQCLLCGHEEPSMEYMNDHVSDEHDLYTKVLNGVTESAD